MTLPATCSPTGTDPDSTPIDLANGLIGLPDLTRLELIQHPDTWPFVTLRSPSPGGLQFLAIVPNDFIPGYVIELNDIDTECLGLTRSEDAQVLNIVTIHSHEPQFVTANLIGPVVINRRTRAARQVIIANSQDYSPRHVLVDERN